MRINDARDLALKLFGIYYFVHFVGHLTNVPLFFSFRELEEYTFFLAQSVMLLFYASLAWLFLFRTAFVIKLLWGNAESSEAASEQVQVSLSLSSGIVLIALYFFINSAAVFLFTLSGLSYNVGIPRSWWLSGSSVNSYHTLILVISGFCILKSTSIERFLLGRRKAALKGDAGDPEVRIATLFLTLAVLVAAWLVMGRMNTSTVCYEHVDLVTSPPHKTLTETHIYHNNGFSHLRDYITRTLSPLEPRQLIILSMRREEIFCLTSLDDRICINFPMIEFTETQDAIRSFFEQKGIEPVPDELAGTRYNAIHRLSYPLSHDLWAVRELCQDLLEEVYEMKPSDGIILCD